jgi:outer membrane protein assembly factor BamB
MRLLALVLAAQAGLSPQLPPAPVKLWGISWHRPLVPPTMLEWHPVELGGPAVDPLSGTVVIGTRDGFLRACDSDGVRLWELEAGGRFEAPARMDGDVLYAGSSDGRLLAVEIATGKVRWTYQAGEEVSTTPVVAGGLVFVMTLQDTLLAVDAKTGAWKWHHRREMREGFTIRGAASVVVSQGLAVGAYSDGTIAALDLATGAVRWERKVAPTGDFMDVDALRVDGTRLFAAAYSGAVYSIDVATGRQLWESKLPGASRLASGGGLVVAVATSQVVGLAIQDGAPRWTAPLRGEPAGEPVVVRNRLAVPNGKELLWLDLGSGHLLKSFNPGTGVSASPAGRGGRVYVLSNAGDLFALDLV